MRRLITEPATTLQTLPRPWERPLSAGVAYVPSAATNITATWRRHGWTPPSESVVFQDKWARFQAEAKFIITPASCGERNIA